MNRERNTNVTGDTRATNRDRAREGDVRNGTTQWQNRQNGEGRVRISADTPELSALREKIRELGFVKVELELYLDTHPDCRVALDYYYKTTDALASLMDEYHAAGGNPLIAAGSADSERWSWVNMPWPWQNTADMTDNGTRGER